jgi:hypothetical protein
VPKTNVSQSKSISELVAETQVRIDSWADFHKFYEDLGQARGRWCFRGHQCAQWRLETSIERVTRGNKDRVRAEVYFIRAFQRKAHHFLRSTPAPDDRLEWLALMQHWGVPTRLLDFTTSPYIALFFALNEFVANGHHDPDALAAVWAVHHVAGKGIAVMELNRARIEGLPELTHSSHLGGRDLFERRFFADHKLKFVAPVQPFLLNERQSVQQGIFLCPSTLSLDFEVNLVQPESFQSYVQASLPEAPPDPRDRVLHNLRSLLRKAVISRQGAHDILPRLYSMNLNSGSLFPDLRGYASSIVERYRALQLLPYHEKQAIGFDALSEFDSLG